MSDLAPSAKFQSAIVAHGATNHAGLLQLGCIPRRASKENEVGELKSPHRAHMKGEGRWFKRIHRGGQDDSFPIRSSGYKRRAMESGERLR